MLVLAIPLSLHPLRSYLRPDLLSEREAESFQQRPALLVIASRGRNGDIHAAHLIDCVVLDLRKNDLFAHAHAVVAAAIETTRRDATKIANTRHRHGDEAIEKLVHAI